MANRVEDQRYHSMLSVFKYTQTHTLASASRHTYHYPPWCGAPPRTVTLAPTEPSPCCNCVHNDLLRVFSGNLTDLPYTDRHLVLWYSHRWMNSNSAGSLMIVRGQHLIKKSASTPSWKSVPRRVKRMVFCSLCFSHRTYLKVLRTSRANRQRFDAVKVRGSKHSFISPENTISWSKIIWVLDYRSCSYHGINSPIFTE